MGISTGRRPKIIWNPTKSPGGGRERLLAEATARTPLSRIVKATGLPSFKDNPGPIEFAKRLLQAAAEVEHEFILQYLFAAYTLPGGRGHPWYSPLVTMAKEEMGHFLSVQNLLLSIGAQPQFHSESRASDNTWYPVPPERRALDDDFIAKFLVAESPLDANLPAGIPPNAAKRHVGIIYATLYWLFLPKGDPAAGPWKDFPATDFQNMGERIPPDALSASKNQASATEWGWNSSPMVAGEASIILNPVTDGASVLSTIYEIAGQGEGLNPPASAIRSHYERWEQIYTQRQAPSPPQFAANVVSDPTLSPGQPGSITEPTTLLWAQLAAYRYEILLLELSQAFQYTPSDQPPHGDTTPLRTTLFGDWALQEMSVIGRLGVSLAGKPATPGTSPKTAGPMLNMPVEPLPATRQESWARHKALIQLCAPILSGPAIKNDPRGAQLVAEIVQSDQDRTTWMSNVGV
jgi:hypothetical protein